MFPTNEEANKLCGKISKQEFWLRYSIPLIQDEFKEVQFQIKRILNSIADCIINGVYTTEIVINNWHVYGEKIKVFFKPLGYSLFQKENSLPSNSAKNNYLYIVF